MTVVYGYMDFLKFSQTDGSNVAGSENSLWVLEVYQLVTNIQILNVTVINARLNRQDTHFSLITSNCKGLTWEREYSSVRGCYSNNDNRLLN